MKIIISPSGYPDLGEEVEITPQELNDRLTSGDLRKCVGGYNETATNDELVVYHAKDDFRS